MFTVVVGPVEVFFRATETNSGRLSLSNVLETCAIVFEVLHLDLCGSCYFMCSVMKSTGILFVSLAAVHCIGKGWEWIAR